MKSIKLWMTCIMILGFIGCEDPVIRNQITLSPQKSSKKSHLGKGVWLNVPKGYKKAKSYDGYQARGMNSSISVRLHEKNSDELKKSYDPKNLKKRGLKLIELSDVAYGESGKGFLSVVHDKPKNLLRYLLSISYNGATYNITSFCPESRKSSYDPAIRKSLGSVYIGDLVETELFQLATITGPDEIIYTKDGKYPTESEDGAMAAWTVMKSLDGMYLMGFVEKELKKIAKDARPRTGYQNLENGKFYFSRGASAQEDKKVFVALLAPEQEEGGVLVKCYGNSKASLEELETYVRKQLITTTIAGF